MTARSTYCPIIGKHVTRLTKVGGGFAEVACPEYDETDGVCALKHEAYQAGKLPLLLEAVYGGREATKGPRCGLA